MFRIEHPDDFLARTETERELQERRNRLARALRGSTPPFDGTTERELRAVMQKQLRHAAETSR